MKKVVHDVAKHSCHWAAAFSVSSCDSLLAAGHSVIGVDNLSPATSPAFTSSSEKAASACWKKTSETVRCGQIDYVFNFASPASPIDYTRLGVETHRVKFRRYRAPSISRNMCRLPPCLHLRCYGDPEVHPQVESYWGHVNP
jgi:dTDP-glucose 4,6-dehydratase